MRTISIVGVGLIGASFALAVRKAGFGGAILGVSSSNSIESGIRTGAIDRGVSLEDAGATSDLIYLAQPIEVLLTTLERLGPLLKRDCLVTDAGSTKTEIVARAHRHLPPNLFLGGHPMAGKEQRGAEAADPDLFRGRPYILTGARELTNVNVAAFREYLTAMGARIVEMTPEEHDRTVALTSHLPQLLSTALAATLAQDGSPELTSVFGPGLLDMTRLALSAPEIWLSVLRTNGAAIEQALSQFEGMLRSLRKDLDTPAVADVFEKGRAFARAIRRESSN